MNHSFNIGIAVKYGMLEAVLLEHLSFWIAKNKANGVNFQDGYYWTYNSTKALAELFPYVSKNTISRALHHLEKEGLLISGNYNKSAYDRTTWYALTEKGVLILQGMDNSICTENTVPETGSPRIGNSISQNDDIHFPKWEMEEPELGNGITQSGTPIPDINTDIETDSNSTVSKDTVCQTGVRRVMEQWNSLAGYGIKPVSSINPKTKRYDMLRARIRSYGLEKVMEAIENIKNSGFLCGNNKSGWAITFDWFVRPNNFIKVLEGNYNDTRADVKPADTGQQRTGKSGYPLELLEKLAGGNGGGMYG